jgi:hypothetical protein
MTVAAFVFESDITTIVMACRKSKSQVDKTRQVKVVWQLVAGIRGEGDEERKCREAMSMRFLSLVGFGT